MYKELFDALSKIFFEADPIEINFGTNSDEYEPWQQYLVQKATLKMPRG